MSPELKAAIGQLTFVRPGPAPEPSLAKAICGSICGQLPHIVAWVILLVLTMNKEEEWEGLTEEIPDLKVNVNVLSILYTVYVFLPLVVNICLTMRKCMPFIVFPFTCLSGCAMGGGAVAIIVFAVNVLKIVFGDDTWA